MAGTKRTRGRRNLRSKKVSKMRKNTLRRKTLRRKTMKRNNRKRNTLRRKTRGGRFWDTFFKREDPACQLAYYATNNTNILFFNIFDLFAAACYNESFRNVFQGSNKLDIQPLKDGLRKLALYYLVGEKKIYKAAQGEGGIVKQAGRYVVGIDEKDPIVAFRNYWPGEDTAETSERVAEFLKLVKKLVEDKNIRQISGSGTINENNDTTRNFFEGYLNGSCGWHGYYHNRKAGENIKEYIENNTHPGIINNIEQSLLISELKDFSIRRELEQRIEREVETAEYADRAARDTSRRKIVRNRDLTADLSEKYRRR